MSLIEMTMSLIITAILIVACALALRLAFQTMVPAAQNFAATSTSATVSDDLVADLNVARNFTERTAAAVTFTVPDRTGDGTEEQLRYAWSGASGDNSVTPAIPAYTVTRQYNGGTRTTMASNVRTFGLSYLTRLMTGLAASAAPSGSLAIGYNPAVGNTEYNVTTDAWVAASFRPPASVSTSSTWRLDRVRLWLKLDGASDTLLKVQVRRADSFYRPTTTVLAEAVIPEVRLTQNFEYVEVSFSTLTSLSTTQNLSIVVLGTTGTGVMCRAAYITGATSVPSLSYYTASGNRGVSWSAPTTGTQMRYQVYGSAN